MKRFIIRYVKQAYFGQGFRLHVDEVWGAVNTYRVLNIIRSGKNPAVMVWVTCE